MTDHEKKFLRKIADNPGSQAADMPRGKRGETLKTLELAGYIHYGPGGWYVTDLGTAALGEV